MRSLAVAFAATAIACGPKVNPQPWVERELGQSRARDEPDRGEPGENATTGATPGALPVDLTTLDAAAIDRLDEATVLAALQRAGDAAPAAQLALRAARLAFHRGDDASARAHIARAMTAADLASVRAQLDALGAQVQVKPVDGKRIAVLLPLSGRYASIGRELEVAIRLAPAQGTSWLFLDTKGDPDAAIAAVEQAVARGALGILGPVGERESLAAARAAALRGIPIGLLAPGDGADVASGVFRLVQGPADEGRAVAQLAVHDNFPTVGVFAPRDDVGQEAAEAFVAEARRLGIQVTAQGTYDPTGGNLEPEVKAFLNLVPATNPRFARHLARHGKKAWTTFSPDVPYTLLYVPDRHDRGALVAAFLPYFGVELRTTDFPDLQALQRKHGGNIPQVVQLVGGAGWHHATLPLRGGDAVQGALVVDAFAGELGADGGAAFVAAFTARTKRTPTSAAAQAHDAALLVATARRQTAATGDLRAAFRNALARAKIDDGACGAAAIGRDGEVAREPVVLEVQGDSLILVH